MWFYIICLAVLDTLFGNRYLPFKARVVYDKKIDVYYVCKRHRFFFIPIKLYLQYNDKENMFFIINWNSIKSAIGLSLTEATKIAKTHSIGFGRTMNQGRYEYVSSDAVDRELLDLYAKAKKENDKKTLDRIEELISQIDN